MRCASLARSLHAAASPRWPARRPGLRGGAMARQPSPAADPPPLARYLPPPGPRRLCRVRRPRCAPRRLEEDGGLPGAERDDDRGDARADAQRLLDQRAGRRNERARDGPRPGGPGRALAPLGLRDGDQPGGGRGPAAIVRPGHPRRGDGTDPGDPRSLPPRRRGAADKDQAGPEAGRPDRPGAERFAPDGPGLVGGGR